MEHRVDGGLSSLNEPMNQAGPALATVLLMGSQIGLAVDYTADAQARQLATARTRVVDQQAAPLAPVGSAGVSKQDAPVTVF